MFGLAQRVLKEAVLHGLNPLPTKPLVFGIFFKNLFIRFKSV